MARRKPPLSDVASKRAVALSEKYEKALLTTSERLAIYSESEYVLASHVDQANEALKCTGLAPPGPFYKRSDFSILIGSILIGLGPTLASIAKDVLEAKAPLAEQPVAMWCFMIAGPVLVAITGTAMTFWGFARSPERRA